MKPAPWETDNQEQTEFSKFYGVSPSVSANPNQEGPTEFAKHYYENLGRPLPTQYNAGDAARAFGKGLLNAPASFGSGVLNAVSSLEPAGSPNRIAIDTASQNIQRWNWEQPWSPQFEPIAHEDFYQHPVVKTAWNVGNAIPQMMGAFGITALTGNPFLGSGLALGVPIYGDMYATALDKGLSHEKAMGLAATSAVGQTILEGMVLKGLFAGGSKFRLMARGAVTEAMEEGAQGLLENSLALVGWGGETNKTLAENLTDGLLEQMVAGAVMGGGMGAISPASIEDVKVDMKKRAHEIIKKEAEIQKVGEKVVEDTRVFIDGWIDKYSAVPNASKVMDSLAKGISLSLDPLVSGLTEVTSAAGTTNYINVLPMHDPAIQSKARDMAITMTGKKKWSQYPTIVQNMIIQIHADLLANGVSEAEIVANAPELVADEVMQPNNVYVFTGGKWAAEAEANDDKAGDRVFVWNPLFGTEQLERAAGFLKNPTTRSTNIPDFKDEKHAREFGDDYRGDAYMINAIKAYIEQKKISFDQLEGVKDGKKKVAQIKAEIALLEAALDQAEGGGVFNMAIPQTSIPPALWRVAFAQETISGKDPKKFKALSERVYDSLQELYRRAPGDEILPPEYNEAAVKESIQRGAQSPYVKPRKMDQMYFRFMKNLKSPRPPQTNVGIPLMNPTAAPAPTAPVDLIDLFTPKGTTPTQAKAQVSEVLSPEDLPYWDGDRWIEPNAGPNGEPNIYYGSQADDARERYLMDGGVEGKPPAKRESSSITDPTPTITESIGIVTRSEARKNPDTVYLFGDNDLRTGLGGQAKEMRGEPNAIGIRTKHKPSWASDAFLSDDTYEQNIRNIDEDFAKIPKGKNIVILPMGVGMAKLPEKAPRTYAYLRSKIDGLKTSSGEVSSPQVVLDTRLTPDEFSALPPKITLDQYRQMSDKEQREKDMVSYFKGLEKEDLSKSFSGRKGWEDESSKGVRQENPYFVDDNPEGLYQVETNGKITGTVVLAKEEVAYEESNKAGNPVEKTKFKTTIVETSPGLEKFKGKSLAQARAMNRGEIRFVGQDEKSDPETAKRTMEILAEQKRKIAELEQAKAPLPFTEYIIQVLSNRYETLTRDEYADALRTLKKMNTEESAILYEQLLTRFKNNHGFSVVEQMYSEVIGEDPIADNEVLPSLDKTEESSDDEIDTDVDLNQDDDNEGGRYETGRTMTTLEQELLKEIHDLLGGWRDQLKMILIHTGAENDLTAEQKRNFDSENLTQRAQAQNPSLTESIGYVYRVMIQKAAEKLSPKLRDKIMGTDKEPGMSLDQLFDYVMNGGFSADPDMNVILEQAQADMERGHTPTMIEFMEPTPITILSGVYEGKNHTSPTKVILKGSFSFTPNENGRVRLRDGIDVHVDVNELAKFIREQAPHREKIKLTNLTQRLAKKLGNKSGFWRPFGESQSDDAGVQHFRYQQKSPFDENSGTPTTSEPEIDPQKPREHRLSEFMRTMDMMDLKKNLIRSYRNFVGDQYLDKKEAIRKVNDMDNNFHEAIMDQVMADKRFLNMANYVARAQIRPLADKIWEIADAMGADPQMMARHGITNPNDRKFRQQIFRMIDRVLFNASEEIFSKEGNPNLYSLTQLGQGGIHELGIKSDGAEAMAYATYMERFMTFFGFEFTPDDQKRWLDQRDPASFFTLAGRIDPQLQNILTYSKAMYETPLLLKALKEGIFHNADMWGNIYRGYSRRVFQYKTGVQSGREQSGNAKGEGRSTHRPGAKYRTNAEFVEESIREDLQPFGEFTKSMFSYTTDTLALIQQWKALNWFKSLTIKNSPQLPGANPELLGQLKYVEYEDSPVITKLAADLKLQPNAVLERLGFAKNHNTPGFAEFHSNGFKPPYIYSSLNNIVESLNYSGGELGEALNNVNQALAFFKRVVTINPVDSAFIFMSGVMMNTPVMEWFTDILPSFGTAILKQGNIFSRQSIGRKMLAGEYWGVLEAEEIENFENLPLFIRHGWTAYSHSSYLKSVYDKNDLGAIPYMESSMTNWKEFVGSVAGSNAAIFEHFIARKVYGVTDKIYKKFLNKGMEKEEAARRAVKLMNDFSFMLDSNIWGPEGKAFSLIMFTRNIAAGTIRIMSGAAWPLLKKTPLRNMFGLSSRKNMTDRGRRWSPSRMFQAWFHGESSASDMDALATHYQMHILKVMTASLLINSALQFMLSFWDDDKEDEHSQIASREPKGTLIKKRYMIYNEPNKRFAIRIPGDRDLNQRRLYIETQFMREAKHMLSIAGLMSDKWAPVGGTLAWFKNRLNAPLITILDIAQNRNAQTGGDIYDPRIDNEYNTQAIINYVAKSLVPLAVFLREEERIFWGDQRDLGLAAVQPLGFAVRRGTPAEAGTRVEDVRKAIKDKRLVDFIRKQDQDNRYFSTQEDLRSRPIDRMFTRETRRSALRRKRIPGRTEIKGNRRAERQLQEFFKKKGK